MLGRADHPAQFCNAGSALNSFNTSQLCQSAGQVHEIQNFG
jgi:hypothetical protein